jgi:hypothetical protein
MQFKFNNDLHPRFESFWRYGFYSRVIVALHSSQLRLIPYLHHTSSCIEFALKNIGLWWRYRISRHCDEWKYIIIGRIFESEIILIPPSLKISENSSNRNTDVPLPIQQRNVLENNWHVGKHGTNVSINISDFIINIMWNQKTINPNIRKWNYFNTSFIEDFRK